MDKPKLEDAILKYLRDDNKGKSFSSRQIAEEISNRYPSKYGKEKKKFEQLIGEVSCMLTRDMKHPELEIITDPKPQKYRWVDKGDKEETEITEDGSETQDGEKGLYEPLKKYLEYEWGMHAKRIDHEKSGKRKEANNKWLHPDIVGVEILDSAWQKETKGLADEFDRERKKARLWSFEVKKGEISRSNARYCFFQAVANSSWANFGYLVAEGIKDIGTRKELRMLADLHGIGVIILLQDTPEESYIVIPAQERDEVDWAACNPLTEVNSDFRDFVQEAKKRMTLPNKEFQVETSGENFEVKRPTSVVPTQKRFIRPVLQWASGQSGEFTPPETVDAMTKYFNFSAESKADEIRFREWTTWSLSHLKYADLLLQKVREKYEITDAGRKEAFSSDRDITIAYLRDNFPSYRIRRAEASKKTNEKKKRRR